MDTLMLGGSLKCVTGLAGTAPLAPLAHAVAGDAVALRVLADGAIRGAVLLAATAVVAALLRRSSAATRHLVWCLGLSGALALVALPPLPPAWHLHVAVVPPELVQSIKGPVHSLARPDPRAAPVATASPLPYPLPGNLGSRAPTADAARAAGSPRAAAASTPLAPVSRRSPWPLRLALLWAAGTLVAMTRVLVGIAAAARLARRSQRVTDPAWMQLVRSLSQALGLRRRVTLYRGGRSAMPLTFGVLRPALLLPEEAVPACEDADTLGWSDERRRVVLLHELAHVKRRDCLTQLIARLACCVHWFNPLAWLAAQRLRVERERACDDLVLTVRGHGPRPSEYAAHLLAVARSLRSRTDLAAVGVAMARPSQLEGRLLAVLDAGRNRRVPGRLMTASAVASLLVLLMPLSLLRVTRADDRGREPARAPDRTDKPRLPVDGTTPFVGDLPSGGRLELVAVSNHPSKGQAWWAPDGSPLRGRFKGGFVTFVKPVETQGKYQQPMQVKELVLRMTDVPPGATYPRWRTATGEPLSYDADEAWPADDAANKPKGETREWRAAAAAFPAGARSVDLQVGLAAGAWRTVAENPASEAGVRPLELGAAGVPVLKDIPLINQLFVVGGNAEAGGRPPDDAAALRARMEEIEKAVDVSVLDKKFGFYNGRQIQLDRLDQERKKITAERSGLESRVAALTKDMEAGRTHPDVEREINQTGRYVAARAAVDRVDIEIEQLSRKFGPGHDRVVDLKRQRGTLQAKVDEIKEELKSNYGETMKNALLTEIAAAAAKLGRVEAQAEKARAGLEQESKLLEEYRALKGIAADLRRKPAGASFTRGFETGGNTVVSVAHGLTDHEVRVAAVGEDGREIPATSGETRATDGVGHTTATFANLTPKQIKTFRLQARPFEWVEFRGVALAPKSKAQAEKEQAEKRQPEKRQDAEAARDVSLLRARHEQLLQLKESLRDAEELLAQAEGDLKQAERDAAANKQPSVEDWGRVDPTMESQVKMLAEQQFRHEKLKEQLGEKHPAVEGSVRDMERRDKFIRDYAAALNSKYVIRWKPDGSGGALIPRNLEGIRASVKRLRAVYEREAAELRDLQSRR